MDKHQTIYALSCAANALAPGQKPGLEKHKVYRVSADVAMDATVDDCHHDGASEWGVLGSDLYTRHKMHPPQKWTKVSRVSYTPKRMTLLARLIRRGKTI